jgi:hypothetical protein
MKLETFTKIAQLATLGLAVWAYSRGEYTEMNTWFINCLIWHNIEKGSKY